MLLLGDLVLAISEGYNRLEETATRKSGRIIAPFFILSLYSTDLLGPSVEARAPDKEVIVFEIFRGSPIKMDYFMQDAC